MFQVISILTKRTAFAVWNFPFCFSWRLLLKDWFFITVIFQMFGLDQFAKFPPIFIFLSLIVSIQKQNNKIGCHFYRVFSQDQLKWIFYFSPTAHAQSGHWWLFAKKNNSRIYFLQRCNSVNALIRLIESNKQ